MYFVRFLYFGPARRSSSLPIPFIPLVRLSGRPAPFLVPPKGSFLFGGSFPAKSCFDRCAEDISCTSRPTRAFGWRFQTSRRIAFLTGTTFDPALLFFFSIVFSSRRLFFGLLVLGNRYRLSDRSLGLRRKHVADFCCFLDRGALALRGSGCFQYPICYCFSTASSSRRSILPSVLVPPPPHVLKAPSALRLDGPVYFFSPLPRAISFAFCRAAPHRVFYLSEALFLILCGPSSTSIHLPSGLACDTGVRRYDGPFTFFPRCYSPFSSGVESNFFI